MNYTVSIDLDLPRDRVVELFDNPDNMTKWQEGLVSFEPISGEPGQPGAKSRLVFQMGKRRIEMVETVTERSLPDSMSVSYEAKGVFNVVKTRFSEVGQNQTHWENECEFQFSGFMKIIAFFMKGAFPKQTLKYMNDFKAFAVQGIEVNSKVDL